MDRTNDRVTQQENRFLPVLFVGTVFLSAMLGFQIQPLISRAILPWFGGSPSVWTVCLLFFQACLFAGYYYAFKLIRLVGLRGQVLLQVSLLAAALFMPVLPSPDWKPRSDENPEWRILWLLTCHVGLAYLAICATSPLLQVWFLRRFPGKSPYWLYACSNAGSLLGLVSVPFILDVSFSVTEQAVLWYSCFAVLCGLIVSCGLLSLVAVCQPQDRGKHTSDVQSPSNTRRPASGTRNRGSSPSTA